MTDFSGHWINQNGSILILEPASDHTLRGSFQSRKGRAAKDRAYPVIGVCNGELATLAVSFDDGRDNLHSITSFSGRRVQEADGSVRLHTVWVLSRQFEDEARSKPTQAWNSFLINTDIFTLVRDSTE